MALVATSAAETFQNTHSVLTIPKDISADPNTHVIINTFYDFFVFNTVDYSRSTSAVFIDLAADVQHGGFAEGDRLINIGIVEGSNFNDVIRGSDPFVTNLDGVINDPGDNLLHGGRGDDILEGRGGGDTLDGGEDSDTASYKSSPAGVQVTVNDPDHNGAFVATGGDAAGDKLISIENLIGSAHDDVLTGASNDNVFVGGAGNDIIDGKGGIDTVDYSTENLDHVQVNLGSSAAAEFISMPVDHSNLWVSTDHLYNIENIIGTSGADQITGNGVDNVFDGGFGNDILDGGGGINTASFQSWDPPALRLDLRPTTATISLGTAGHDGSADRFSTINHAVLEHDTLRNIQNVTGSNLAETITGNEQRNTIDGRGGNDVIDGGFGNDTLDGGSGTNTVTFASHDLALLVTDERDTIALGQYDADGYYMVTGRPGGATAFQQLEVDALINFQNATGSNHAEVILGEEHNNTLNGRGGNDDISGFEGNDTLLGGDGNDRLIGGADADTLTGGANADTFAFTFITNSANNPGAFDTIADFELGFDRIDMSRIDANVASGFQHFTFSAAETIGSGEINAHFDAARNVTVVEANTTNASHNDFHLELLGHINLTASDFIL